MTSRDVWTALDTIHRSIYVVDGAAGRYAAIGLTDPLERYLAARLAALGPVGARTATAVLHGFAPDLVASAIPALWGRASVESVLSVRLGLAIDALAPHSALVNRLTDRVHGILDGVDWAAKPLAAAHADQPADPNPAARLWQTATALREYRGDAHIAVLTAAGLGGAEANRLIQAVGHAQHTDQQQARGWSDQAWQSALDALVVRGWTDAEGQATESGRSARERLEEATDRVVAAGLDREATSRLVTVESDLLDLASRLAETMEA